MSLVSNTTVCLLVKAATDCAFACFFVAQANAMSAIKIPCSLILGVALALVVVLPVDFGASRFVFCVSDRTMSHVCMCIDQAYTYNRAYLSSGSCTYTCPTVGYYGDAASGSCQRMLLVRSLLPLCFEQLATRIANRVPVPQPPAPAVWPTTLLIPRTKSALRALPAVRATNMSYTDACHI